MLVSKFNLGDKLRDKITGFEGICLAISFYATGCIHYGMQSEVMKDGKPIDWEWSDETYLKLSKAEAVDLGKPFAEEKPKRKKGGPSPTPPQA